LAPRRRETPIERLDRLGLQREIALWIVFGLFTIRWIEELL